MTISKSSQRPVTWNNPSVRVLPILLAVLLGLTGCGNSKTPVPIQSDEGSAPALIGSPAKPQPIDIPLPPANPHMGVQGTSYMHADGYSSDTQPQPGPLGNHPAVLTRDGSTHPGGMCAIQTFTHKGKLVALCAGIFDFELKLLDPRTLDLLASYKLPTRPSTWHALFTFNSKYIMTDTSGAYFYLDNKDRVVIGDAQQHIQRVAVRKKVSGKWAFEPVNDWDMSKYLPHDCWGLFHWFPHGGCDPITALLPDHDGRIWWVSRHGRVGTLDTKTGKVRKIRLKGEEIQNGFSVAREGVYIVSDHAMYDFTAAADGTPKIVWREPYDRGSNRKVGSIDQGSGTTPTLLGKKYVTITDNADGRINLLVYRRAPQVKGKRLVCKVPLFKKGASATDNSMIGLGRAIIIENNHGYVSTFGQSDWNAVTGGIWRVDVRADGSGCDVVWKSSEKSPSVVPTLSAANGLAYFYTFKRLPEGKNAWYLMALDFRTGKTAFKINTGIGSGFDNNWSSITLGPDGTAYIGTFKGLVGVRDQKAR